MSGAPCADRRPVARCTFRLRLAEKEFLQKFIDQALNCVETRDRKKCSEYACRAILADRHMLETAKVQLRPVVLAKIKTAGASFFKVLLNRDANFIAPKAFTRYGLSNGSKRFRLKHPC